jgi:hypothetical protein
MRWLDVVVESGDTTIEDSLCRTSELLKLKEKLGSGIEDIDWLLSELEKNNERA